VNEVSCTKEYAIIFILNSFLSHIGSKSFTGALRESNSRTTHDVDKPERILILQYSA